MLKYIFYNHRNRKSEAGHARGERYLDPPNQKCVSSQKCRYLVYTKSASGWHGVSVTAVFILTLTFKKKLTTVDLVVMMKSVKILVHFYTSDGLIADSYVMSFVHLWVIYDLLL